MLYDHVHDNIRDAITENVNTAEKVRLGECMKQLQSDKADLIEID